MVTLFCFKCALRVSFDSRIESQTGVWRTPEGDRYTLAVRPGSRTALAANPTLEANDDNEKDTKDTKDT